MNLKVLTFLIALGVAPLTSSAQTFTKLDQYFDLLEKHDKFMGSVAVSKQGQVIYRRSVGFSHLKTKSKIDENTKFRVGSITKTFTAVLTFKAIEEGKLQLTQTINRYFPQIKNADKITIHHLLAHRSGIFNFTARNDYLTWHTQPKTKSELLQIIEEGGNIFEPGQKAEYSNANYVLLSLILEDLYQKKFGEIVEESILRPLQLTNSALGEQIQVAKNEAKSYRYFGSWLEEPETHMSIPRGAGALVSTPTDLVIFADALFSGKLISLASLENMTNMQDGYGAGLFPIPFYQLQGFGHSGGIDGFSSFFCHFPTGDVSYAITSNGANFPLNDINIAVLSSVYDRPFDLPSFEKIDVSEEELEQLVGVYASAQLPLKITISRNQKTLIAQASGQPAFSLEALGNNKFKFDQAGVLMEFQPTEKTLVLKQGGGQFLFKKE